MPSSPIARLSIYCLLVGLPILVGATCSSFVTIQTDRRGYELYDEDGKFLGNSGSPVLVEMTHNLLGSDKILLRKKGDNKGGKNPDKSSSQSADGNITVTLEREWKIIPLVSGPFCLLVPCLWSRGPAETQNIKLPAPPEKIPGK